VLPPKALFAIGAAVIAGVFVASMLKSRGETDREIEAHDSLEKYGEEQARRTAADKCHDSIGHAVSAAADYLTSRYGEGAPEGIRELAVHRCTADQWSLDAMRCLDRVTSDNEMQRCIGQLEEYQRRALEAEMKAFALRPPPITPDAGIDANPWADNDDYSIDPPPPPPPPTLDPSTTGMVDIPECMEYGLLIERMATECDKLPAASRDALRQGYDAMKSGWSQANLTDEVRKTMGEACKQATDALKQAGTAMCGW
jgi:hypothetical protein